MRILLLSEGGFDVSRDPEGALRGVVAILVKRAMQSLGIRVADAQFEFGFWSKFHNGNLVRGNDKRLTFTITDITNSRPDISAIVVLIDADGDGARRLRSLRAGRAEAEHRGHVLALKTSIGVAVQMVEAWLIADHNAVVRILGRAEGGSDPEGHADPKAVLAAWIDEAEMEVSDAYAGLANENDLVTLQSRAASFKRFVAELKDRSP
jgi:hypothetical protein